MEVSSPLSQAKRMRAGAIAAAAFPIVAVLGRTLTWRTEGTHHYDDILRSGRQPILALWHGRILAATLFWRNRGIVALTSQNFDGEWIARLMGRFGYSAARGSTSRGGARALAQLRRSLREGRPAAFTVDGPRGPARVVKPGVVWLARATGNPILPFHIESSRCWTARSWDRGQVPKPFSRVAVAVGRPIHVAAAHSAEELGEAVSEVGRALIDLEVSALRMLG